MRRQLNSLYITTEGAWLKKEGANIVMQVEGKERARLPIHMLESLVCFGRVLISPPLMGFCAEQGVTITHLSPSGKFLARIEGPVSGNVRSNDFFEYFDYKIFVFFKAGIPGVHILFKKITGFDLFP